LELIPLILNHLDLTSGQSKVSVPKSARALWFDPDKLTALAALTLSETAPHNVFLETLIRGLVERSTNGRLSTTQSNVLALWALANYIEKAEADDPALKVKALIGERELAAATIASRIQKPVTASANLSEIEGQGALRITAEGSGEIWSTVKLEQAPREANLEPELGAGLHVSRAYSVVRPAASDPGLTSFTRGQVVRVDLVLVTLDDRSDLVLEDVLPAGFEPVNFRLKSEDQTLSPLLYSSSGDNTGWWSHQQIWPDRVAVFADRLPAGVYNFSYLARPATPGVYKTPGPMASGMYEPETFGRGRGHVIEISD
jgi:uncharacterized protein YfaS (alpha-2-macroglobulin family)